jgi:hypothetical protein
MGSFRCAPRQGERLEEDGEEARMAIKYQCPFCGRRVEPESEEFRWVTIMQSDGFLGKDDPAVQGFGCHFECLDKRIGDATPVL